MKPEPLIHELPNGSLAFSGVLTQEDLESICDDYLKSLHCTLWGRGWDVISPRSRRSGASFLAKSLVEALS